MLRMTNLQIRVKHFGKERNGKTKAGQGRAVRRLKK